MKINIKQFHNSIMSTIRQELRPFVINIVIQTFMVTSINDVIAIVLNFITCTHRVRAVNRTLYLYSLRNLFENDNSNCYLLEMLSTIGSFLMFLLSQISTISFILYPCIWFSWKCSSTVGFHSFPRFKQPLLTWGTDSDC